MADPDEKEVDDLHEELSVAYDKIDAGEDATIVPDDDAGDERQVYEGRDELGRFARRTDTGSSETVQGQGEAQGVAPQPQHSEASPSPMGPPSSWSVAAKAEFDRLAPPVREAIAKREWEVSNGFQQYHERYRPLDNYIEIANRAGTDLPSAIQAWMNAEELLHRDFEQGMLSLCEHFNVDPRALAARWGGGGGSQQPQQGGQMPAAWQQQFYALKSEIDAFKQDQEQQQFFGIKSEVDMFGSRPENKYFENVRTIMAGLIKTGVADDLQDAYDKACWSHPEIRQLQINEQLEAQTRANRGRASAARRAAGSLAPGSPIPGAGRGRGPDTASLRDQLLQDWDALSA